MKADLAIEGGGIRGIAYAGALEVFERAGVEWQRVAGTSAGAIAAAFVACGFNAARILQLLDATDFRTFVDRRRFLELWDTYRNLGMCSGDRFERWMFDALGGRKMAETEIPLTVITADLANGEIVALSSESHPHLPVATAVRMSMSIPFMFRAVRWQDGPKARVCVDGGVCLNYPVELFDVHAEPRWPTFGFLLDEGPTPPRHVANARDLGMRLFEVMRAAPAKRLDEHNDYRTVRIPDGGISWLNFALTSDERRVLLANGSRSAESFLQRWRAGGGFDGYLARYRAA
jgi:NTE family protein